MSGRSSLDWTALVSKYENSDQSISDFCVEHSIRPSAFYYHRRKLSSGSKNNIPEKFYPATLIPAEKNMTCDAPPEISLDLPHGIRLTIRG